MLFFLSVIGAVVALRAAFYLEDPRGWRRVASWSAPLGLLGLALAFAPRGMLLTKSLGRLAMPLGLLWCALLALALAAYWRRRYRDAAIVAALFVALTAAGSGPLERALTRFIEGPHADAQALEAGPFDAVIVLGGGTSSTPRGEAQLGSSGDRVMLGVRLYRAGRTPLLVTSGSPIAGLSSHDAMRATSAIWRELGVPSEAIVEVEGARTTSEEATAHAALVAERGWTRVGLVSSARHLPRALGLFRAAGLEPTPLPADVRSQPTQWRGFFDLIPNAGAAQGIHAACWELVGRLAGR